MTSIYENIMGEVVLFDVYDTFLPVEIIDCNIHSNLINLLNEQLINLKQKDKAGFSLF